MPRPSKYTAENVAAMVSENKIAKRGELQKFNPSAYAAARKNGWLEDIFPNSDPEANEPAPKTKRARKASSKAAAAAVQQEPKGRQKRTRAKPDTRKRAVDVTLTGITEVGDLQDILALAKARGLGVEHTFAEAA